MRANVFTDPALAKRAGQFVWLALDTEKAKNAAVRKRLGVQALPTFFIVDPADEQVALRWVGGASVAQLAHILDDGRAAVAASAPARPGAPAGDLASSLARADRLYGASQFDQAADAYREVLAAAPASWPPYGRVVESRLFALNQIERYEEAATLAYAAYGRLRGTPSGASVAGEGLDAAVSLPESLRTRARFIEEFEGAVREVLADPELTLAGDDRSGLYISLLDARKDAKDDAGAHQVAEAWADCLEKEAAKAKTPEQRAVYDSHRVSAYVELGEPERALPMLEQSERDFPGDYNPPARLAIAYRAMKRWRDGLAASDRAFAKAYGPRKLVMYPVRVDLYLGLADTLAARKTLEEAVGFAESLPPGQRSESSLASLKKRLASLAPAGP